MSTIESIQQDVGRPEFYSRHQERQASDFEVAAIARDWLKVNGTHHPVFGHVKRGFALHDRSVAYVAQMLRKRQDIEAALKDCEAKIGLDPECLREAAVAKLKCKSRARCQRRDWEALG
jgi:hypothetical protein